MNTRFSTLLLAFTAVTVLSTAQATETKYTLLQTAEGKALTWTKQNSTGVDSVGFYVCNPSTMLKSEIDSALWRVEKVRTEQVSGKSVYTFTNKATKRQLSFAKEATATQRIASGVNHFTYDEVASGNHIIGASIGGGKVIYLSATGRVATEVGNAVEIAEIKAPTRTLKEAEELTGRVSTLKFTFAGKAANLFTETELIPVEIGGGRFKFQVKGQEKKKDTEVDQYITIDTLSYEGAVFTPKFQLDTLAGGTRGEYKGYPNGLLQSFTVSIDLGNDSLSLSTRQTVVYKAAAKSYALETYRQPYLVGYKALAEGEVLTSSSKPIEAPLITYTKGIPAKLPDGGGIYAVQLKSTGDYKPEENGKYLVYARAGYTYLADAAKANVAYTQVYVKEEADGTYSMQSREGSTVTKVAEKGMTYGNAHAPTLMENEPIYKAATGSDLFVIANGINLDTVQFTKMNVDKGDTSLGYRYFTNEERNGKGFALKLASEVIYSVYLTKDDKSLVKGKRGALNDALFLQMNPTEAAEGVNATATDSIYYGASLLGDTLMRVSYAMEESNNPVSKLHLGPDGKYLKLKAKVTPAPVDGEYIKRFFFAANEGGEGYVIVAADEAYAAIDAPRSIVLDNTTLAAVYDRTVASNRTAFTLQTAPTSNEAIHAPTIRVVAGQGSITLYGAAGRRVVVSDAMGRATTLIATSDSQTLPTPAGIVFISVQGEATVKAVVR